MIATVLNLPVTGEGARAMAWRQLVDIVAQAGERLDPATRDAAHARISELRAGVSAAERRSAAAGLAGRAGAEAVAIFAADEPAIAAPVLARAQLKPEAWLLLIPKLPSTSRTILRNRRDLDPAVERALASYGASDFALPAGPSALPVADPQSQIRNLVERIEAFRSQHPAPPAPAEDQPVLAPAPDGQAEGFAFETRSDGVIDWVAGAPRTALIGLSVAEPAPPRGAGVDGQAAGAFRRRAPFRDARLIVAGAGPASGDWLIAAQPIFNPHDGRFAGYRGEARRPRLDERAPGFDPGATVPLAPDSLRQLVHELRTPLNAIQGFAEMIDRQMLGPAASAYRDHARSIVGESQRLLEVVEDLDTAARLDGRRLDDGAAGECDASAILAHVASALGPSLAARGIALAPTAADGISVALSQVEFERLARRLLATVASLAESGETVAVTLARTAAAAELTVGRTRAIANLAEHELLDPGFGADGEWPAAPLLGLGFSLRLIGNLARAARGSLDVGQAAFTLTVPLSRLRDERAGEQG